VGKDLAGASFCAIVWIEGITMKRLIWIICVICTVGARGQEVSQTEVQVHAASWLRGNPLAMHYRHVQGHGLEVGPVERLIVDPSLPPFYLVHLIPRGYLVMNGDRRLPPVVCFDLSENPDLGDPEENALYQLLLAHGRRNARTLASGTPALTAWEAPFSLQVLGDEEVIGPLLATSWDQGNYYNEECPPAASAPDSSDGRAPTGCAATAFAQIMKYHEWPYRGAGSFTYEDASGSLTGVHTAVFSDPYDWPRMQNEYYAFGQEPEEAVQAVAELMYELGVAARTDYEATASAAASAELASRLRRHFLYEMPIIAQPASGTSSSSALLGELAAGRPCLASIPGHGFVIDGHLRQGADDFFHVNYGWSGRNDGWCLLDDIQGEAVAEIGTGIRPLLVAIPLGSVRAAQGWELRWVLPRTRAAEVTRVDVLERALDAGTFTDHAEAFTEFEITSTSGYQDWVLESAGYAGNCYYKPAGGYANRQYHLTSTRVFRPGAATVLVFQAQYKLYDDGLAVLVSTDDGDSFAPVWSVAKDVRTSWTEIQVPLGAFAGQEIRVRFEYLPGHQTYVGGGVWLDEIELASGQWYDWSPIRQIDQAQAYRAQSTVTFQDGAEAFTNFKVTSTGHYQDWSLSAEGYTGGCFYKPAGGYGNVQYHLTSTRTFRPGPGTHLTFKTRYALAQDGLSVQVSTNNGGSFTPVWSVTDTIRRNWTDVRVPLAAFAGKDILIRFEYLTGSFYLDEGVALDEIRLVDIAGAEYLDGPVYHTSVTNLSTGSHVLAYQLRAGEQAGPRSETFTVDVSP
jgi:hypothetical protein